MTTRWRARRLLFAGLLISASLALGACGGSSDDTAAPTTAPGGTNEGSGASSTSAGNGNASSEFCTRATALESRDDKFTPGAVAGYTDLLEVAPDEVRPRIETIVAYLEATSSQGQAAAQKVAELSPKYATDSVRFVRFINENC
jgi:hypothetical protein